MQNGEKQEGESGISRVTTDGKIKLVDIMSRLFDYSIFLFFHIS